MNIIYLIVLLGSIHSFQIKQSTSVSFQQWQQQYSIHYENIQTYTYRYKIYRSNIKKITQHNLNYQLGNAGYKMSINRFADLTERQFGLTYGQLFSNRINNGINNEYGITNKCNGTVFDAPNPPIQVDWTIKAVGPIQNEGKCPASWAFTAVGAIEGLYALKKGKFLNFSQQQLIDCSGSYGNEGCSGGFMDQAFWYVIDNGITLNTTYNYTAVIAKCKYVPSMKIMSFKQCARVPYGNYSKLLSAAVQQPTSVAVAMDNMQFYSSGIYDGNCTGDVNRGMLLVGYGEKDGNKYWRLKNSLGTNWGQQGYISIERKQVDGEGKCGIQVAASVPQSIQ